MTRSLSSIQPSNICKGSRGFSSASFCKLCITLAWQHGSTWLKNKHPIFMSSFKRSSRNSSHMWPRLQNLCPSCPSTSSHLAKRLLFHGGVWRMACSGITLQESCCTICTTCHKPGIPIPNHSISGESANVWSKHMMQIDAVLTRWIRTVRCHDMLIFSDHCHTSRNMQADPPLLALQRCPADQQIHCLAK